MRKNYIPSDWQSKRKYQVITEILKLAPFLDKNLPRNSKEYQAIRENLIKVGGFKARETLYNTGEGYYEKVRTENSFNHCRGMLKKDGVEEEMRMKVVSGAVVCSLIDYILQPKENMEETHYQVLEDRLKTEYMVYLESPHRE